MHVARFAGVVAVAWTAVGCGDRAGPVVTAESASGTPSTIMRTLAKGVDTKIALHTLPSALCELGAEAGQGTMRLFSDDRGVVSFHARLGDTSEAGHGAAPALTLTCSDDSGARAVHSIQIRSGEVEAEAARAETAALDALDALPHLGATVLPALSVDDAAKLAAQDLRRMGYPPKPNADAASKAYRHWLELVGRPITVVPQHLIEDPGVHHDPAQPANHSIWSGVVLTGGFPPSGHPYAAVMGQFSVPRIVPRVGASDYSALWVGLGSITGVAQDGTTQSSMTHWIQVNGVSVAVVTTGYTSWTEYYPAPSRVTSVAVNPGDQVEAFTWIGDVNGNENELGGYAWFYLYNLTTGAVTGSLSTPQPSGVNMTFICGNAEWIMERPGVGPNQTPSTLANYGTATMINPIAHDFGGAEHTFHPHPFVDGERA